MSGFILNIVRDPRSQDPTMETLCVFLQKKCNFLPHVKKSLFRLGVKRKKFNWAYNLPFLLLAKFTAVRNYS